MVRTPAALVQTSYYLLNDLMDLDTTEKRLHGDQRPFKFNEIYSFVRDRLRAVNTDFNVQHIKDGTEYINCLEQSVRFHILSAYELAHFPAEEFNPKQNNDFIDKCLISLLYAYSGCKSTNNQEELMGYYIMSLFDDELKMMNVCKRLPRQIQESQSISFALRAFCQYNRGDYVGFFSLIGQATYLQACLLHRYFGEVRLKALKMMRKSMRLNVSVDHLIDILWLDDLNEAIQVCELCNLEIDRVKNEIILTNFSENVNCAKLKGLAKRSIASKRSTSRSSLITQPMNNSPIRQVNQCSVTSMASNLQTSSRLPNELLGEIPTKQVMQEQKPVKPLPFNFGAKPIPVILHEKQEPEPIIDRKKLASSFAVPKTVLEALKVDLKETSKHEMQSKQTSLFAPSIEKSDTPNTQQDESSVQNAILIEEPLVIHQPSTDSEHIRDIDTESSIESVPNTMPIPETMDEPDFSLSKNQDVLVKPKMQTLLPKPYPLSTHPYHLIRMGFSLYNKEMRKQMVLSLKELKPIFDDNHEFKTMRRRFLWEKWTSRLGESRRKKPVNMLNFDHTRGLTTSEGTLFSCLLNSISIPSSC